MNLNNTLGLKVSRREHAEKILKKNEMITKKILDLVTMTVGIKRSRTKRDSETNKLNTLFIYITQYRTYFL